MVGALGITMVVATVLAGAWTGWQRGRDELTSPMHFMRRLGICLLAAAAVNLVITLAIVGLTRASLGAAFSITETLQMLAVTAPLWLPVTGIAFTVQAIRERRA